MSLILPPNAFAYCTDWIGVSGGTPSNAGVIGAAVTAGANDADGTAVASGLGVLAHDVHFIVLKTASTGTSGANAEIALDLLIDPAGGTSWAVLINDIAIGMTKAGSADTGTNFHEYFFPIFIPANATLGFQAKTHHTATIACRAMLWAFGEPSRPDLWWCGRGVETLGASGSGGTAVTPGNTGAWGSWTNVGATTGALYGAVQLGWCGRDAVAAAMGYYAQMGYGGLILAGSPSTYHTYNATESGVHNVAGPIWCNIPQGTQMQVRAMASGTADIQQYTIYGVY